MNKLLFSLIGTTYSQVFSAIYFLLVSVRVWQFGWANNGVEARMTMAFNWVNTNFRSCWIFTVWVQDRFFLKFSFLWIISWCYLDLRVTRQRCFFGAISTDLPSLQCARNLRLVEKFLNGRLLFVSIEWKRSMWIVRMGVGEGGEGLNYEKER